MQDIINKIALYMQNRWNEVNVSENCINCIAKSRRRNVARRDATTTLNSFSVCFWFTWWEKQTNKMLHKRLNYFVFLFLWDKAFWLYFPPNTAKHKLNVYVN